MTSKERQGAGFSYIGVVCAEEMLKALTFNTIGASRC